MKTLALTTLVLLTATGYCAEMKVAVVDMIDLVRFHPGRKYDRETLKAKETEFQAKIDAMREGLDEQREKFEKAAREATNPALSPKMQAELKERALKQRDTMADMEQTLRMQYQQFQQELQSLDSTLLSRVTKEIRAAISVYAEKNGYSIVYDRSMLPYSAATLDVTEQVMVALGIDPEKVRAENSEEVTKPVTSAPVKPVASTPVQAVTPAKPAGE